MISEGTHLMYSIIATLFRQRESSNIAPNIEIILSLKSGENLNEKINSFIFNNVR